MNSEAVRGGYRPSTAAESVIALRAMPPAELDDLIVRAENVVDARARFVQHNTARFTASA